MFRNILVSIDGSKDSDRALAEAIDLAEAEGGRLTIITAVQQPPSLAFAGMGGGSVAALAAGLERESRDILEAAERRVPQDVSVTTILSQDPIRPALLQRIREGEHDVVVIGSRGRGAVQAAMLGSVSHYVLNHSPVPVLIVHGDRASSEAPAPEDAAAVA
jgi:nucleotide-binding universal stress UspA family protein